MNNLENSYSNPHFVFQEQIGSGTFGQVFKAYDVMRSKLVAIKRTIKKGCYVSREYKILQEVKDSDYCIKLLDIFYTINANQELIQHLVFDYMPISLGKVLRANFPEKIRMKHREIVCISRQLLQGLRDIHEKSIVHRDIKPDNILLTLDFPYQLKICDFGSAKKLPETSTPYIISRFYRAPELIFCAKNYGTKVDIWSAGCLMLELYTGFPVFRGITDGDQFIKIAKILGPPTKDDIEALNTPVMNSNVMSKAIAIGERQNIKELFIISPDPEIVENLVLKMLSWNPKNRFTAEECLEHPFFDDGY